jgi:hypothetical protein
MLGPDRFNFETPNVIDPGEMPPSRPSRQANSNVNVNVNANDYSYAKDFDKHKNDNNNNGTWGTTRNETYDSSDLHERSCRNYKPQLSQGIKLSDYRIEDYKDDGEFVVPGPVPVQEQGDNDIDIEEEEDDDDAEYGRSSQLPTSEQARLFAAAMLTESDRRRSQRHLQVPAKEQDFGETVTLFRPRKSQSQRERRRQHQRLCRNSMTLLGLLALVAGFTLAVVLALQATRSSNSSSASASERMAATVDWLSIHGFTHEAELTTPGTPQNRAALWMADEDRLQLDIPAADLALETTRYAAFVQRYALAVFFFSTKGEAWSNSLQFISDQHECSWFHTMPDETGEIFAVGVTCDAELRVRNLLIRKYCMDIDIGILYAVCWCIMMCCTAEPIEYT